jgi:flagellar basal-body rod modification protein FlgD
MQVAAANYTTAGTSATGDSTKSSATTQKKSPDSQMFLQLLVAQLRNQDPMSPMDNQAFIAQMAQLQSVDQLTSLNTAMKAQQEMESLTQSLLLMGKKVDYVSSDGQTTASGTVEGVQFDQGLPTLIVDGQSVLPGDVLSVKNS